MYTYYNNTTPLPLSQLIISFIRREGGRQVLVDQCNWALVLSTVVLVASSTSSGSDTGNGSTSVLTGGTIDL